MENRERKYVRILKEICDEEGILLDSFSYDWAFRMRKDGKTAFILGYQFGLNLSSVQQICRDKNITSEILRAEGIPCVYHSFHMSPSLQNSTGTDGNWKELLSLLEKYGKLVVKDNYGTGGNQVYLVSCPKELEAASAEIFRVSQGMAVCPYEEIEKECRMVLLDGEIKLAFSKIRLSVTGDGVSSFGSLLAGLMSKGCGGGYVIPSERELKKVLLKGEKRYLNWKHNLGQGAVSNEIALEDLPGELIMLAEKVNNALQLRFASVDVIFSDGSWKVLEVNSRVMMEHFAGECHEHYKKAKEIYREAVLRMFL